MIGTANITESTSALVIDPGQSVTITYIITGAVSAWLGGDMMPGVNRSLIADGAQHTYTYTPTVSGPFPICAQDAAGGVVICPISVIVRETLPAISSQLLPTLTTIQDGAWDDPATWGGVSPTINDVVLVGHNLTVAGKGCVCAKLLIDGTVTIAGGVLNTSDLHVRPVGSLVLDGTGSAGKALVLLRNRPKHTDDSLDFWRVVFVEGNLQIRGLPVTPYSLLAVAPKAGDTTLILSTPVAGWNVGNKVVLPDSRQYHTLGGVVQTPHMEIVIVRGVSSDGLTVFLLSPVRYDHPGVVDSTGVTVFTPHALNMIRTAGFVTSDPTAVPTRAHMQISGKGTIDCQYGVFHGMGRSTLDKTTRQDRMNCRLLNLVGPTGLPATTPQFSIQDCVFLDPYPVVPKPQVKWGLSNNSSSDGLIKDNIFFNWAGAGFALETGGESRNIIDGNVACRINGSGNRGEMGTGGDGFWLRGPNNYFRNNIACNIQDEYGVTPGFTYSECYGFSINMQYTSFQNVPNYPGADVVTPGQFTRTFMGSLPLLECSNNQAYNSPDGYTWYWIGCLDNTHAYDPPVYSIILRPIVWNCWRWGMFPYSSANLTIQDYVCLGDLTNVLGTGITHSDYTAINLVVDNARIEGKQIGIYPSSNPQGGSQTFRNCTLRNQIDVNLDTLWTSASSSSACTPRLVILDNNIHAAIPGQSHLSIKKVYATDGQRTLALLDALFVTKYNGVAADNFQVFYTQQAAGFVMPQSTYNANGTVKLDACPVAGLTNAQSWAQYSIAIGGAVAPANATTRSGITGLVA